MSDDCSNNKNKADGNRTAVPLETIAGQQVVSLQLYYVYLQLTQKQQLNKHRKSTPDVLLYRRSIQNSSLLFTEVGYHTIYHLSCEGKQTTHARGPT